MSATGRGADREEDDFYSTPPWVSRAIVLRLEDQLSPHPIWWEPCAGDGAIIQATSDIVRPYWFASDVVARGDIEELADSFICADVLTLHQDADVIITNPPFRQADEILQHTLSQASWVLFLLRLNWLGSIKRAPFFKWHMPDVYVLPRRPSFKGGQTDATEYAWFVWGPWTRNRSVGVIEVLDLDLCR